MDREKVKRDFEGISTNLISVRKQLAKQMSCERKSIKSLKTELKRRNFALRRLLRQKRVVETNMRNLSTVRNNLAFVTDDRVSMPTWTSSDEGSVAISSSDEFTDSVI